MTATREVPAMSRLEPARPHRLQVALVGAGVMGRLHARTLSASPDADLACVVDVDEVSARRVAEQYAAAWAADLDDPTAFDAVIVAAPTSTHADWAGRVLPTGTPLLLEKPLADDLDEARRIVELSARHDAPLMCGFLERNNPAIRAAFEIARDPVHVTAVRHSPYAPRIATGVAYDLMIHDIDLVLRLAGTTPAAVLGMVGFCHPTSVQGAEDVAEASLVFDSGLVARISASRVAHRKVRRMTIVEGTREIEVDLVRQDVTIYQHVDNEMVDDGRLGYRQQTVIDIPFIERGKEPLALQLERFVALVRGDVDAADERRTLLPPHEVVADIRRMTALAASEVMLHAAS